VHVCACSGFLSVGCVERYASATPASSAARWTVPTASRPTRTSLGSPTHTTPGAAEKDAGGYADVPGFCKSATLEEVRKHGHVLTPGRFVGAEAQEDDGEPFDEKMRRLVAALREQQAEAAKLDAAIAANLEELGYGR
jgi:type I restriction-modification system DNA methylase subunit